jgi:hypothetical protein
MTHWGLFQHGRKRIYTISQTYESLMWVYWFPCVDQYVKKGKGKAIPVQAWTGPEGSRWLRVPDFKTIDTLGGKFFSPTHRSSVMMRHWPTGACAPW